MEVNLVENSLNLILSSEFNTFNVCIPYYEIIRPEWEQLVTSIRNKTSYELYRHTMEYCGTSIKTTDSRLIISHLSISSGFKFTFSTELKPEYADILDSVTEHLVDIYP